MGQECLTLKSQFLQLCPLVFVSCFVCRWFLKFGYSFVSLFENLADHSRRFCLKETNSKEKFKEWKKVFVLKFNFFVSLLFSEFALKLVPMIYNRLHRYIVLPTFSYLLATIVKQFVKGIQDSTKLQLTIVKGWGQQTMMVWTKGSNEKD